MPKDFFQRLKILHPQPLSGELMKYLRVIQPISQLVLVPGGYTCITEQTVNKTTTQEFSVARESE